MFVAYFLSLPCFPVASGQKWLILLKTELHLQTKSYVIALLHQVLANFVVLNVGGWGGPTAGFLNLERYI